MRAIHQPEVTRGLLPEGLGAVIDCRRVDDAVGAIVNLVESEGVVAPMFVTLPVAGRLSRKGGLVTRGLFFPVATLAYSRYASILPKGLLLNDDFVMMPWGRLGEALPRLATIFGRKLFLRPDSPRKPFTGVAGDLDWLLEELPLIGRTERIDPAELVIVAPGKGIDATEHRFWIVGGEIVTAAPYGWDDTKTRSATPDEAFRVAQAVARCLEFVEENVVADVAITTDGAKLIELNAISTSGFYPGVDADALIDALLDRI